MSFPGPGTKGLGGHGYPPQQRQNPQGSIAKHEDCPARPRSAPELAPWAPKPPELGYGLKLVSRFLNWLVGVHKLVSAGGFLNWLVRVPKLVSGGFLNWLVDYLASIIKSYEIASELESII